MTDPNVERDALISRMQQAVSKPPEEPKTERQRMSMDEIMAAIDDVARDPEDRDRFKALRMLASEGTSSVVLPEPMSDSEIIARLMRVMKPSGQALCQLAYKRAFPVTKLKLTDTVKVYEEDLTDEQKATVQKIKSLKHLYRVFPEIKRAGVPTGFPTGKGLEVQQGWVRRKAAEILISREQAKMDQVEEADKEIRSAQDSDQEPEVPPAA